MAMSTPWGPAQTEEIISSGIVSVTTASHGGIHLDANHNAQVPDYMRTNDGWYEEDCLWSVPAVVFSDDFDRFYIEHRKQASGWIVDMAKETLHSWYPEHYSKYFNAV